MLRKWLLQSMINYSISFSSVNYSTTCIPCILNFDVLLDESLNFSWCYCKIWLKFITFIRRHRSKKSWSILNLLDLVNLKHLSDINGEFTIRSSLITSWKTYLNNILTSFLSPSFWNCLFLYINDMIPCKLRLTSSIIEYYPLAIGFDSIKLQVSYISLQSSLLIYQQMHWPFHGIVDITIKHHESDET